MATIHILGFAGSLRKQSYNRSLLREARKYLPQGVELETFELDDIPPFNQDLENDPPEPVKRFQERARQADGILIAVPEFNYSFPGVLKNALDWGSRPREQSVWTNKPTALMGAGGRFGAVRSQLHLRQVLLYLDMPTVTKPEVYIQNSWEKFDNDGNLTDIQAQQQVEALMGAFIRLIEQYKGSKS